MRTEIRIIKKAQVPTRTDEEERQRERRAEITLLQVFIRRYPEQARKFVRELSNPSFDTTTAKD